MNRELRKDAETIIAKSLQAVMPDEAVKHTLKDYQFSDGRKILVAIGKAARPIRIAAPASRQGIL